MATINSSAAGNVLDGSKWYGGVAPGAADTAVLLHAMTLTTGQTWTVGAITKDVGGITASGTCGIVCATLTRNANGGTDAFITVSGGTFTGPAGAIPGGSASNAVGIANYGKITTCNVVAGSASSAYGVVNYTLIMACIATGGSASSAHGAFNYATIMTCIATAGSVSGAYGVYNYGVVDNRLGGSFTGTGSGQRGISNVLAAVVLSRGDSIHGENSLAGTLYLFGNLAADANVLGSPTIVPLAYAGFVRARMADK